MAYTFDLARLKNTFFKLAEAERGRWTGASRAERGRKGRRGMGERIGCFLGGFSKDI